MQKYFYLLSEYLVTFQSLMQFRKYFLIKAGIFLKKFRENSKRTQKSSTNIKTDGQNTLYQIFEFFLMHPGFIKNHLFKITALYFLLPVEFGIIRESLKKFQPQT